MFLVQKALLFAACNMQQAEEQHIDRDLRALEQQVAEQGSKGADFIITGDVTEFGRKEVGDQ